MIMTFRILASAMLLISILFLPFYISAILAVLGIIYFSFFFEAAILFLISDLLYGVKESHLFKITLVSFFISTILVLTLEIVKKRMRI